MPIIREGLNIRSKFIDIGALKCHSRMHAISCLGIICKVQASMLVAYYVWSSTALVLVCHQVNASDDDDYPREDIYLIPDKHRWCMAGE